MRNLTNYSSIWVVTTTLVATMACQTKDTPAPVEVPTPSPAEPAPETVPAFASSTFAPPGRVVALGDVHGDFAQMSAALKAAGVIDDHGAWIGGDTTLVQTGDLLDRGDDERRILDFFEALTADAEQKGGRVISLNGNHEVMNVAGDLRYVTPRGMRDFDDVDGVDLEAPVLQRVPADVRARLAAFLPGAPYAMVLAKKRVVGIVGKTVFAHGGVLPHHVRYGIDALNEQTAAWMRGERDVPLIVNGEDSPIWTRVFSDGEADCAELDVTLDLLGAERMVVGHTVQKDGPTSDCDGRVWRIDVGMAAHYGGSPAALEITESTVRVLTVDAQKPPM